MAVALATYVTSENLAGTVAQDYGFETSPDGIGCTTFNVLSVLSASEAADLGLTPDADGNATIIDILQSTDNLSYVGLLYDINDSEKIDDGGTGITDFELLLRILANELYTAINEGSDI